MSDENYSQQNVYLTFDSPLGTDKLLLESLEGTEEISGLFEFDLKFSSPDPELDPQKIVGQSVTATIARPDNSNRYVNGIVTRFYQSGRHSDLCRYGATVRPGFWMLTQTTDCRIFQNKSIPKILDEVFETYGFNDYENNLKGSYKEIEYIVQYNETAFQFVSRLMEEYGIFYFFEHEVNRHILILADDADAHSLCPGIESDSVKYIRDEERVWSEFDTISECSFNDIYTAGQVSLDDYNFKTSTVDLKVTVTGDNSDYTYYEYPGRFETTDDGNELARVRLEEIESVARSLQGQGRCRGFIAGHRFNLQGFYRDDANGVYVLRQVRHLADREDYTNSFDAFPLTTPFRPHRRTNKPIIAGAQTALVVGPEGKEIWTDKYGRVKVQFHWDQKGTNDDKSSCWVRVSQAWAGKAWGAFFLPRIGMEVVVEFLEGDPDRPMITGAVYNGQQTLPYTLPDKQTINTVKTNTTEGGGGYNEIRLDDDKDNEEVYVQAQKDMNTLVKNDLTLTVEAGNECHTVEKGNRTVTVGEGNEEHTIAGTRSIDVTKAETHGNEDNFTHTVQGNYVLNVTGNLTIDVTGEISMKSAKSATFETATATTIKAGTTLNTAAGSSHSSEAGTSIALDAGTSLQAKGGMAVTIEAGTSAEITSSGTMEIQGSLVSIN